MAPPIVYVDRSSVREGRLAELEDAVGSLVRRVERRPGRLLSYAIHFTTDRSTMTVVHVHPDSESLQALMEWIAPALPPFRDLLELRSIDVYGAPGDAVTALLEVKVALLGGSVTVHEAAAGVDRID